MTKGDVLLSRPLDGSSTTRTEVRFWRNADEGAANYENKSEEFVLPLGKGRNYSRQYFHIYRHRLEALRQRVSVDCNTHSHQWTGLSKINTQMN